MNHKPIRYDYSPNCNRKFFENDFHRDQIISSALTEFVKLAGEPDSNDYATLEIKDHETSVRLAGVIAKPRAFDPAYDGKQAEMGWAVAILNTNEYDYICKLPSDEIDNALVNILRLEADDARYWTKHYETDKV